MNLLTFLEVVYREDLLLLELFPFLPSGEAESWEVCTWRLAFMDWDLCYGFGGNFISLKLSCLSDWSLIWVHTSVVYFVLLLLFENTLFSYICIICLMIYKHHYIISIFAPYFKSILKFYISLNRPYILCSSGSKLRRNHIHSN